jgi:hypothetical protein
MSRLPIAHNIETPSPHVTQQLVQRRSIILRPALGLVLIHHALPATTLNILPQLSFPQSSPTVERQLGSTNYDCVVIGTGVRLPPKRIAIFEAVINAVHKAAPGATIAFNTLPENSADAAARWLRN